RSIKNGKGNYMPAWKDIISQDEIEALVSYIRLLGQ
ncbi:MAG: cytochrome c, partial [Deltaproteobacteria bacterium]|nr:cytochrome c [Deltaproteobacteria bacterium]